MIIRDWISTAEACAILGITPRHLLRLASRGEIQRYRLGKRGRPRYLTADVSRLMQLNDASVRPPDEYELDRFIHHRTRRSTT